MDILDRRELFSKPEVKHAMEIVRQVVREVLPSGGFAERERAVLALLDEVGRGLLEQELQALADSFGRDVLVNGVAYKLHEPGAVAYHSLSGQLQIRRGTYREVGVRNGPTIVVLDLAAGLVEGATPALAYNVAHGYAQHDMRLHGEMLVAAHREPPPRATLERLAKSVAAAAHHAVARVEPRVRRGEALPEGAHAVVVGLDRTSVPMAEERPADAPPKPAPRRRRPRTRQPPKPIDVVFRMAYVGTVSIVDKHLVYLRNNKDRMRYVTLAVSGLPVGSGVTESAAKTVVGRRAKNSGQRWSQSGLRHVLTLRALHQNDRLAPFWSHHRRQYQANVEAA
jgi:hypothetical protein